MVINKIIKVSVYLFIFISFLAKEYYKNIIIYCKNEIKMSILMVVDKILDLRQTIKKVNTTISWNLDSRNLDI